MLLMVSITRETILTVPTLLVGEVLYWWWRMVRKTSNEALCSPFIAEVLVQKQYEHFSFPTSGNLSRRQLSCCWPDVGP